MPESNPISFILSEALPTDRRADVRYGLSGDPANRPLRDWEGATCAVRIVNVSVGGLAFLADRWVEPGTPLSVDLPSKDEARTKRLTMRVLSAEAVSPGTWKIGCAFSRRLSNHELLALL